MALTPLTQAQRRAVDALVAQGRIAVVPADDDRAETFMHQAADVIADLPHLTRPQNQYNLAYDACHDVGEALMAGYGYRTLTGPGQHEAIGRFPHAIIDSTPGDQDARRFDHLRIARNQQRYDARRVGAAEAALAAQTATRLFDVAVHWRLPRSRRPPPVSW